MISISITARILLTTAVIGAAMLTLAASTLISSAKTAIELEVNAGSAHARGYVIAVVGSILRTNTHEETIQLLPNSIIQPRHVNISIADRTTGVMHVPQSPTMLREDDFPPQWFVRLLDPPPKEIRLPIRSDKLEVGVVYINNSAEVKINEFWQAFYLLGIISLITYIGTLIALALVFKSAFSPLASISTAFTSLEDGDFSTRIGAVATPDFNPLAERFDSLADTVQQALSDKDYLNRRLLESQDEERRNIGMELHDEFGPSLFGLRVESRAIIDRATALNDSKLKRHGNQVLEIVERIQIANRALLARLRPMEIGELPLSDLLKELVDRMKQLNQDLTWYVNIGSQFDGKLSEFEELNIYRIIQEACTNTLKHASANTIYVSLQSSTENNSGINHIDITIEDDGTGTQGKRGSGITGLHERTESLGGYININSTNSQGTKVQVTLPYNTNAGDSV